MLLTEVEQRVSANVFLALCLVSSPVVAFAYWRPLCHNLIW